MTDKTDKAEAKEAAAAAEEAAAAGETIPGGKYLAADGKTLVDANGEPLGKKKPE